MKISIAMATYNGEKYIREQLESFSSQTLLPDELIITDDCSTDRTEMIVKEYAESAPFNVIFHRNEKNLGYCGNFNAALMKTTGDIVFLSDQDDVWFPEKIATMVALAKENPEMLVLMNDTELTDGELNSVGLTKLGQIKSAGLSERSYVMGCCCAVRRELLDICMPIPEGFRAHDNWLVEFADGLSGKMVDGTVLQYYRRHESNESHFIVNRTKRVGRIDVIVDSIKRLFDGDQENRDFARLQQEMIFLDGVRRCAKICCVKYKERAENLILQCERRVDILNNRKRIRGLPFFQRVIALVVIFFRGEYGGGAKSFFRDLVG